MNEEVGSGWISYSLDDECPSIQLQGMSIYKFHKLTEDVLGWSYMTCWRTIRGLRDFKLKEWEALKKVLPGLK